MPESDFIKLLIFLERRFKSWGIAILITIISGCWYIGYMVGGYKEDWHSWRVHKDEFQSKTEKYIESEQKTLSENKKN